MRSSLRFTLCALFAASLCVLVSRANAGDKDFKDLFNGKDMTGWKYTLQGTKEIKVKKDDKEITKKVPVAITGDDPLKTKTFSIEKDYIKVSGSPAGYFYTDKSYKNYVLKFDWRYKRPAKLEDDNKFGGNSGCLIHLTGEHKVWPTSLEVQGMNKTHASFIPIGGKAVGLTEYKFDQKALDKVRNKVGEWNTTEVTIKAGVVNVKVNGTPISSGKITLVEGPIAFQSEGAELHFKNIKIKVLD